MKPDARLLDQLPPETMLPVHFVRQLLADLHADEDEPLADLTVEQVATALGRAPSTIRSWCHAGEIQAYKLNGREWRISRESLRAYQDHQVGQEISNNNAMSKSFRAGRNVDLASWRREVRKGTGVT